MHEEDRAKGVLLGLAAGDKNGGPVRMAVRVAESLAACGRFDRDDVVRRYHAWFKGPPHDPEKCFDTGPTFSSVFARFDRGGCTIDDASRAAFAARPAPGVNPAHRATPLGAAVRLLPADAAVAECARSEAQLTHMHPDSAAVSAASCHLVRLLVRGRPWADAAADPLVLSGLPRPMGEGFVPRDIPLGTREAERYLSRDGAARAVFCAAVHFVAAAEGPREAIEASLAFAGPVNYCPVLVGAFSGARIEAANRALWGGGV
ncbi:ADP-ribosylglycohydrolase family protein [Pelomyxa schiedti]|nr:ADP-ribosylglycohydrolase family protein [Pelomyxa schiedti]